MNLARRVITYVLVILVLWTSLCGTVEAQTKFLTWLRERVGERKAKDPKQAELNNQWQKEHFEDLDAQKRFVTALKKTRCFTCHAKGEKKEVRNDFGTRLSTRLRDHLEMNTKEISAALKIRAPKELQLKVEMTFYRSLDESLNEHLDTENEESETFGAQWKRGDLMIIVDDSAAADDSEDEDESP